jgi:hypothetical protein
MGAVEAKETRAQQELRLASVVALATVRRRAMTEASLRTPGATYPSRGLPGLQTLEPTASTKASP